VALLSCVVLPALRAIGEDMTAQYVRRAAEWLVAQQNDDGGWGESCASYMDPEQIGRGASTASQTAWAMIGLAATGASDDAEPIRRGTAFLLRSQQAGTWHESQYTGTGFPGYGVGARLALDDADLSYPAIRGLARVSQNPSVVTEPGRFAVVRCAVGVPLRLSRFREDR
jgi:squalene-hopene/tetraprenyl-beta-curcumene cyclase